MKTFLNLLGISLFSFFPLLAQESAAQVPVDSLSKDVQTLKKDVAELKNLKVTGWIQAQFQYVETRGAANFDGGNFAPNSDKRFMIRRGRIKFTYNGKNSQYVMQLNGTERGLNLTEIYGTATDPWTKSFSLTAGVMNRPFGFEIDQSSAVRESPERSRYTQIIMPNERDLGAKVTFAPPKSSKLYGLRLDAGFYNGQGTYVPGTTAPAGYPAGTTPVLGVNEFDYQKDFIGRLCYYKSLKDEKIKVGIGVSHYNGGNTYQNNRVYNKIVSNQAGFTDWVAADTSSTVFKNKTAPRVYYGAELFFSIKTFLGTTTLRGEYVSGTQPGTASSSSSPFFLPSTPQDTYIRNFDGMYAYFIHRIGKSKHEVVVKYEWYDPNTQVTGKDILGNGLNGFTSADIKYTQLGLGYNYYMYENVKFMFYYNIITNESTGDGSKTTGIAGFTKDIADNILTVRMQYRF
jgi:hypothetical protein